MMAVPAMVTKAEERTVACFLRDIGGSGGGDDSRGDEVPDLEN